MYKYNDWKFDEHDLAYAFDCICELYCEYMNTTNEAEQFSIKCAIDQIMQGYIDYEDVKDV